MTTEWSSLGLPDPQTIDRTTSTWTMSQAQYFALCELAHAESHGRQRFQRYQRWVRERARVGANQHIEIVVEPTHLNS